MMRLRFFVFLCLFFFVFAGAAQAAGSSTVIYLVDTSASVNAGGLFAATKQSIKDSIDRRATGDRIILFTFGEDVRRVVDLKIESRNERQYLKKIVDSLDANEKWTWMEKALKEAAAAAREVRLTSPESRAVVYVVTTDCINDPPPGEERRPFEELMAEFQEAVKEERAAVYLIARSELLPEREKEELEAAGTKVLEPAATTLLPKAAKWHLPGEEGASAATPPTGEQAATGGAAPRPGAPATATPSEGTGRPAEPAESPAAEASEPSERPAYRPVDLTSPGFPYALLIFVLPLVLYIVYLFMSRVTEAIPAFTGGGAAAPAPVAAPPPARPREEEARPAEPLPEEWPKPDLLARLSMVKQGEVVFCLRQLAYLIKSGVSIVSSLFLLADQTKNRKLKYILACVRRDVEAGRPLSEAMARFPKTFPLMVTSVLKTGETSGLIDTAMDRVAAYWEERLTRLRKILSSLLYPAIVLLVTCGVVAFMISYVIPRIVPLLEVLGGELPWNTMLLVSIGENSAAILAQTGILAVILIVAGGILYCVPQTRYLIDRYKLRLPLIGPIFQYAIVTHFARTLALLVSSGVSIVESLTATRATIKNRFVQRSVDQMTEMVLYGENLSAPFFRAGSVFPAMVGTMIRVGEETGAVDGALTSVAEIYDQMLQSRIEKMTTLIEPALIVTLGGMVAFVASALIGGILASYGTLGR